MTLVEHAMDRRKVILSSMRRSTNNVDEAEDLFSELLVRCVKHEGRIVGGDGEKVRWLFVAAHNLCVDHCRRPHVKHRSMFSLEHIAENEFDELARDDWEPVNRRLVCESLLDGLTDWQRETLTRWADGETDDEIANSRRVTRAGAKCQRIRARKIVLQKAVSKRYVLGV